MPYIHLFFFFFFNDAATTEIYTLPLHAALPIFVAVCRSRARRSRRPDRLRRRHAAIRDRPAGHCGAGGAGARSEEHTSELQSQSNLVCRLLLEKKKIATRIYYTSISSKSPHRST